MLPTHPLTEPEHAITFQTAQNATLRPHAAAALSSLTVTVGELTEAQDDALMQLVALAQLAKTALEGEAEDAADNVGHALSAISKLAATAMRELESAMEDIRDFGARAGATGCLAPFGRVEPMEAR